MATRAPRISGWAPLLIVAGALGAACGGGAATPSATAPRPASATRSSAPYARGGGPTVPRADALSIEELSGSAPIAPRFRPHVLPLPRARLAPAALPDDERAPAEELEDEGEEQGLPPPTPSAAPGASTSSPSNGRARPPE